MRLFLFNSWRIIFKVSSGYLPLCLPLLLASPTCSKERPCKTRRCSLAVLPCRNQRREGKGGRVAVHAQTSPSCMGGAWLGPQLSGF